MLKKISSLIFFLILSINHLSITEQKLHLDKKKQEPLLIQYLKNKPIKFACTTTALLSTACYYNEIKQFIKDQKNFFFYTGLGAIWLTYLFKDRIINNFEQQVNTQHLTNYLDHIQNNVDDSDEENSDEDEYDDQTATNNNAYTFAKCGARLFQAGEIDTTFEDVAGLQTAKEELSDIVMYLKEPEPFFNIGAHIPKGILLSGPPGNGKTLLARALAGEVSCPFLYINASEFIEAIVGIGAARVRNLFSIAKTLAPCIIYIDEIDAIGKKRSGHNIGGGDSELAQTLNELLAQLDGFEEQSSIVVIGSTNRADILDPALTRPGRFDRKVKIATPFIKDRCKILELHLDKIKKEQNINVMKIARGTPGYSGAELANLINEAAIIAIRQGKDRVSMDHIDQARDIINLGRETHGMDISEQEMWQTAIHEAGHAIARVLLENANPLHKVTITPRNKALGITFSLPKEQYSLYEEQIEAETISALAGSVAEELICNKRGAGAENDLITARSYATDKVMRYGMSEEFKDISFQDFINNEIHLPDTLALKLQLEITTTLNNCRQQAVNILTSHKEQVIQLAHMLVEQGTVMGSDVYHLCDRTEPNIEYSLS